MGVKCIEYTLYFKFIAYDDDDDDFSKNEEAMIFTAHSVIVKRASGAKGDENRGPIRVDRFYCLI